MEQFPNCLQMVNLGGKFGQELGLADLVENKSQQDQRKTVKVLASAPRFYLHQLYCHPDKPPGVVVCSVGRGRLVLVRLQLPAPS